MVTLTYLSLFLASSQSKLGKKIISQIEIKFQIVSDFYIEINTNVLGMDGIDLLKILRISAPMLN